MMANELQNMSDEQLEWSIRDWQNALEENEKEIALIKKAITSNKAELERRTIAKLPIKVGDKMLVTRDMFPKYAEYMRDGDEPFEATIEAISKFDGDEIKAWNGNCGITIEDAITMHEAYLRKHESEEQT